MSQAQDWEKQGNPQFYRKGSMGYPITSWNMGQQHHAFVQNHLRWNFCVSGNSARAWSNPSALLSSSKAAADALPLFLGIALQGGGEPVEDNKRKEWAFEDKAGLIRIVLYLFFSRGKEKRVNWEGLWWSSAMQQERKPFVLLVCGWLHDRKITVSKIQIWH